MVFKFNHVVFEDSLTLAIEILELPARDCPAEDAEDHQHENDRQGNEEEEDVQGGFLCACLWPLPAPALQRPARSAFVITSSELAAIPRPAASGGSQPTSASGTHAAL